MATLNFAQRSAEAAKNTANMIEESAGNGHAKKLVGTGANTNGNGQAKQPSRTLPLDDEDFQGF